MPNACQTLCHASFMTMCSVASSLTACSAWDVTPARQRCSWPSGAAAWGRVGPSRVPWGDGLGTGGYGGGGLRLWLRGLEVVEPAFLLQAGQFLGGDDLVSSELLGPLDLRLQHGIGDGDMVLARGRNRRAHEGELAPDPQAGARDPCNVVVDRYERALCGVELEGELDAGGRNDRRAEDGPDVGHLLCLDLGPVTRPYTRVLVQ